VVENYHRTGNVYSKLKAKYVWLFIFYWYMGRVIEVDDRCRKRDKTAQSRVYVNDVLLFNSWLICMGLYLGFKLEYYIFFFTGFIQNHLLFAYLTCYSQFYSKQQRTYQRNRKKGRSILFENITSKRTQTETSWIIVFSCNVISWNTYMFFGIKIMGSHAVKKKKGICIRVGGKLK
jgi:hypothetical protein